MKKIVLSWLGLALLFGLAGCTPAVLTAPTAESQGKIDELTGRITQVQNDYNTLLSKYNNEQNQSKNDLNNNQSKIDELNKNMAVLQGNYDSLQKSYDGLVKGLGQAGLRNPSWAEVKEFVKRDDTDTFIYDLKTFDCSGYAIILRDRARRLGFRTAYIEIELPGAGGHALDAFETTDKGLVYIDNTEADKVAYIRAGQPYGTIPLDAVKAEYISCDLGPGDFWRPLNYKKVTDVFSYDYYLDYQQRQDFHQRSVTAFNAAVSEFNRGNSKWTRAQMETWKNNLNVLEQELGNIVYESPGVVGNIETYWGDK